MTDKGDPLRTYHQRMIEKQAQPVVLVDADGNLGTVQVSGSTAVQAVEVPSGAGGKSAAVDLEGRTPRCIQTPSGWTTSDVTFEGSFDGETFVPIVGVTLEAVEASQGVAIDPVLFGLWPYVKVVSTTDQSSAKTVQLISGVV